MNLKAKHATLLIKDSEKKFFNDANSLHVRQDWPWGQLQVGGSPRCRSSVWKKIMTELCAIKKDFKIKFIVNISFFNSVNIGISQLPDLVTRGQFYKTLIYCDSMVIPSFCVIKQYHAGNYCGMEQNKSSIIKQYPLLP